MKKVRFNKADILLIVFSVIFSIYLIETVLYFVEASREKKPRGLVIAKRKGISFDERNIRQVVYDFKRQGVTAYPAIWPGSIIRAKGFSSGFKMKDGYLLPLSGISKSLTILGNESGRYSIYESDEHGFNNPDGHYKTEDVNLVLIGDSMTQGCCVSLGQDLGSQLRRKGNKILNLGYGYNGPLLELATLIEYGKPIEPDVVVWVYFEGNDLWELSDELKSSPLLKKYLYKGFSQSLIGKQDEIDGALKKYFEVSLAKEVENQLRPQGRANPVITILKLTNLRSHLGFSGFRKCPFEGKAFKRILTRAKGTVSEWGGKMLFVYLPSRQRFTSGKCDGNTFNRNDILRIVSELKIPLIDIAPVFDSESDPLSLFPFGIEPHYTARGYSMVAEVIEGRLKAINRRKDE